MHRKRIIHITESVNAKNSQISPLHPPSPPKQIGFAQTEQEYGGGKGPLLQMLQCSYAADVSTQLHTHILTQQQSKSSINT